MLSFTVISRLWSSLLSLLLKGGCLSCVSWRNNCMSWNNLWGSYKLKQSLQVWFGKSSYAILQYDMYRSIASHLIFYLSSSLGKGSLHISYVDEIMITSSDSIDIMIEKLSTSILKWRKYFLGIKDVHSKGDTYISQWKYLLGVLKEFGMLETKPIDIPMDPNVKIVVELADPLSDQVKCKKLLG